MRDGGVPFPSSFPRALIPAFCFLLLQVPAKLTARAEGGDSLRPAFGLSAGASVNIDRADFRALPGVPNCCPRFTSGRGLGPAVAAFYLLPLNASLLLSLRGAYVDQSVRLTENEPILLSIDGAPVDGLFEHRIDAYISTIGLEPLIGYRLTSAWSLWGGIRGAYVARRSFDQVETLIQPADRGTFLDGTRTRNAYSGQIPNASTFSAALLGGTSYMLPLNAAGTWFLAPEIFYQQGLTPVVKDLTWNASALRAGIAVLYMPKKEAPPPPPPPPPPAKPPAIAAKLEAAGVEADGTLHPAASIRIEEFISTQMIPLLNYVFFAENSSTLPARYQILPRDSTGRFDAATLESHETLFLYHHVLNIIGSRMRKHPEAALTVIGCNADEGIEKGNRDLSRKRAETVRDYLRDTWEIPENRISIDYRNLPDKPTTTTEEGRAEENRRVELHSATWEILEPVTVSETLRVVTPTTIRFLPTVVAQAGLQAWSVQAGANHQIVREFASQGSIPAQIDWVIDQAEAARLGAAAAIDYRLAIGDRIGQHAESPPGQIPIEQMSIQKKRREQIADREIDRYNLILFDFDAVSLNDNNQRIARYVRERLREGAEVSITGYTDRIGDEAHNKRLSEGRARSTARALGVPESRAAGLGENTTRYDNNLPEGRFYSRTVDILVQTPLSNGK